MIINGSVRRIGATLVGVVGTAVLIAGCSSSSNGKPVTVVDSTSAGTSTSAAASSLPGGSASAPVVLPSSGAVGAGASQFCKDISGQGGLGDISGSGDPSKVITIWDTLTAEAPDEIKADMQAYDDFLHNELKGKVDPTAASKLSTAAQHIGTYIATNCH